MMPPAHDVATSQHLAEFFYTRKLRAPGTFFLAPIWQKQLLNTAKIILLMKHVDNTLKHSVRNRPSHANKTFNFCFWANEVFSIKNLFESSQTISSYRDIIDEQDIIRTF